MWLASWPRSGNSWLRTLLANFLVDADAAVSFGEGSARIGSGLYSRGEFDDWTDVPSGCCTDEEADLLRPAVYRAHAAQPADAGRVLFCRIHDAFLGNGAAEPLFPDDVTVGAIYLVRNPLDVAVSWAYYAGHGDVARSVVMLNDQRAALPGQGQPQLRQRLLDWSGHVRSWTGAPFLVLAVWYEDLLADTGWAARKNRALSEAGRGGGGPSAAACRRLFDIRPPARAGGMPRLCRSRSPEKRWQPSTTTRRRRFGK